MDTNDGTRFPPPIGWRCPQFDLPADGQSVLVWLTHGVERGPLVYRHPLRWKLPPMMGDVGWQIVGWKPA